MKSKQWAADAAKVMVAYAEGRTIECSHDGGKSWLEIGAAENDTAGFDWENLTYRIQDKWAKEKAAFEAGAVIQFREPKASLPDLREWSCGFSKAGGAKLRWDSNLEYRIQLVEDKWAAEKVAHAAGKPIQFCPKGSTEWIHVVPSWSSHGSYRVKPEKPPIDAALVAAAKKAWRRGRDVEGRTEYQKNWYRYVQGKDEPAWMRGIHYRPIPVPPEREADLIAAKAAWAAGKNVEMRNYHRANGPWEVLNNYGAEPSWFNDLHYRPIVEKLRPWTATEVPVNCAVRLSTCSEQFRCNVIGVSPEGVEIYFNRAEGFIVASFQSLFDRYLFTTDGKTWSPCGVAA